MLRITHRCIWHQTQFPLCPWEWSTNPPSVIKDQSTGLQIGAVPFIGLLLLKEGIESNPGPKDSEKELSESQHKVSQVNSEEDMEHSEVFLTKEEKRRQQKREYMKKKLRESGKTRCASEQK